MVRLAGDQLRIYKILWFQSITMCSVILVRLEFTICLVHTLHCMGIQNGLAVMEIIRMEQVSRQLPIM